MDDDLQFIRDYDHFENARNAHLKLLSDEATERRNKAREAVKEESLKWWKDGYRILGNLNANIGGFHSILRPHRLKKECMSELLDIVARVDQQMNEIARLKAAGKWNLRVSNTTRHQDKGLSTSLPSDNSDVSPLTLIDPALNGETLLKEVGARNIEGRENVGKDLKEDEDRTRKRNKVFSLIDGIRYDRNLQKYHSSRILQKIKPSWERFRHKTQLIRQKFAINRELRSVFYNNVQQIDVGERSKYWGNIPNRREKIRENDLYEFRKRIVGSRKAGIIGINQEGYYQAMPSELKVSRLLFREYMRFIPVDKSLLGMLHKKRDLEKKSIDKLDLIRRTMTACEFIAVCKSVQHFNPKGCSNCGVLYLGGTLNGVQYVKSVSRDTGVATLVTLEFEKETLIEEEKVQLQILAERREDLQNFEDFLFGKVRTSMQAWLCHVLCFKRYRKLESRLIKYRDLYRRRRLVKLKREVDTLIKEAPPLDIQYFTHKYYDIYEEMLEYTSLQSELKRLRIWNVMIQIRKQIVNIVECARERRRLEELERNRKIDRPIVIKKVPKHSVDMVYYQTAKPATTTRSSTACTERGGERGARGGTDSEQGSIQRCERESSHGGSIAATTNLQQQQLVVRETMGGRGEKGSERRSVGCIDSALKPHMMVCPREGCHLRQFVSVERFNTHMAMHFREDRDRVARFSQNEQNREVRDGIEGDFLDRLTHARAFITEKSGLTSSLSHKAPPGILQIGSLLPPHARALVFSSSMSSPSISDNSNEYQGNSHPIWPNASSETATQQQHQQQLQQPQVQHPTAYLHTSAMPGKGFGENKLAGIAAAFLRPRPQQGGGISESSLSLLSNPNLGEEHRVVEYSSQNGIVNSQSSPAALAAPAPVSSSSFSQSQKVHQSSEVSPRPLLIQHGSSGYSTKHSDALSIFANLENDQPTVNSQLRSSPNIASPSARQTNLSKESRFLPPVEQTAKQRRAYERARAARVKALQLAEEEKQEQQQQQQNEEVRKFAENMENKDRESFGDVNSFGGIFSQNDGELSSLELKLAVSDSLMSLPSPNTAPDGGKGKIISFSFENSPLQQLERMPWTDKVPDYLYTLHGQYNTPLFYLEMVSRQGEVTVQVKEKHVDRRVKNKEQKRKGGVGEEGFKKEEAFSVAATSTTAIAAKNGEQEEEELKSTGFALKNPKYEQCLSLEKVSVQEEREDAKEEEEEEEVSYSSGHIIPLDKPVIRIGTDPHTNEVVVFCTGKALSEERVSPVHCVLYTPLAGNISVKGRNLDTEASFLPPPTHHPPQPCYTNRTTTSTPNSTTATSTGLLPLSRFPSNQKPKSGTSAMQTPSMGTDGITVVDNHSKWGTYVVSHTGARRVTHRLTAGAKLQPGMLLCVGVLEDGPELLSATEANQACVVYRVRCREIEQAQLQKMASSAKKNK